MDLTRAWPVLPLALIAAALLGWLAYEQLGETPASAVPARSLLPPNATAPAAPPMPYRFAGLSAQGGATHFLLEREGRVFPATAGMRLDRDYRVDVANEREIALVYLPLGLRQQVPMNQAAWPPPTGNPPAGAAPIARSPLPPAVQRTTSPALLELAR